MPIMYKLISIMGVFGVFVIGVAYYATSQMRAIDNGYSQLLKGDVQGAIHITRANRDFVAVLADLGELQLNTDPTAIAAAKAEADADTVKLTNEFDAAATALPAYADEIRLSKAGALDLIDNQCAKSTADGMVATTSAEVAAVAPEYLNDCAAKFPAIEDSIAGKVNTLIADEVKQNAALTTITNDTIYVTYGGIIGGLILVIGMGIFLVRNFITTPIVALQSVMARLASGDLRANVPDVDRGDEIGSMARAVQTFKDAGLEQVKLAETAKELAAKAESERQARELASTQAAQQLAHVVSSIAKGLEKLSAGDLMFRLNDEFTAAYDKLRVDFNNSVASLQETMQAIASNTQGVRSGAGEITQASDDLARRTEQQAASLEETAAALEEITATVRKTAEGANEARDVVTTAKGDAETSGAVVRETVEAMSGIEESSKKIGNIIGVIDEIAFQTNLLALNAGVEAARAGDAGRGFAVVATEVRALAQRSADAAKEIKALISESGKQVETGVKLVGETGRALGRIVEQVNRLNVLVSDIAGSAQEQATGLSEVNSAVSQMDQVTQQNAAMVEESTAASHSLAGEAEALAGLVGQFQLGHQAVEAAPPPRRSAPVKSPALTPRKATAPVGKFVPVARPALPASAGAEDWGEF
ncbi:MAG: HAMP domain-containing methyl-accepting chemotaxis protein [Acidocella sp.]|nr:HAMP domain-containing methyl-accepting chemotaxis protein [Acidocella sp.]